MSNFIRCYKDNNTAFITIVTYNRKPILIKNIELLRNSFKSINYEYKIIAGIVLHDHLHIIITTPNAIEIPKIISSFKVNFSRNFSTNLSQTKEQISRREKGIWQRKYYDHIIRNEQDLYKHLDYIHYNSVKHYNISPIEWEYSSFKKFVQQEFYESNWYNLEDKNKILNLNLE